jgi:hypothetical protein
MGVPATPAHKLVGGTLTAGQSSWVGEAGPELITTDDSARLAKTAMTQPAHGPYSSGPKSGYTPSKAHPRYSGGSSKIVVRFDPGALVAGHLDAAFAQAFMKQLKVEFSNLTGPALIGSGVSS